MEQAIKIAIENGYVNRFKDGKYDDGTPDSTDLICYSMLLAPAFWQALGKGLGWGVKWGSCKVCFLTGVGKRSSDCTCEKDPWLQPWYRFIDHLISGKDIESFFSEILNVE